MRSFLNRTVTSLAVAAVLLLAGAGVASAHVTVAAPGVTTGQSDATIIFRVPDESATASTVGLKVAFPLDHPIAGVLVAPVPGWTATMVSTKLAKPITTDDGTITQVVSEIDWAADAASGIKPGFFGQFTVIAGQLPDGVNSLTFKAIQTYSDKTVVSWIEQAAAGSSTEPDHPAPELKLLPAAGDSAGVSGSSSAAPPASAVASASSSAAGSAGAGVSVTPPPAAAAAGAVDTASKGSVTWATVIAILGVLIGGAGVALAVAARRRPAAQPR